MGFNFPANPITGAIYQTPIGSRYQFMNGAWQSIALPTSSAVVEAPADGRLYTRANVGWLATPARLTALPRNLLVNPNMSVSQENTYATKLTTTGAFAADQWHIQFQNMGSANLNFQNDGYRLRAGPDTATQATLAADAFCGITQIIEGSRLYQLQWAKTIAIPLLLDFYFAGPTGTYTVCLSYIDNSYSLVLPFSITPTTKRTTIPVPYNLSKALNLDNTASLRIEFVLAAGSNYLTSANYWDSASRRTVAGAMNVFGTLGNIVYLTDVALYPDPYGTGIAPPFEPPDYAREIRECQRYFYKDASPTFGTSTATTSISRAGCPHPVTMRAVPTVSIYGGTIQVSYGNGVAVLYTAIAGNYSTVDVLEYSPTENSSPGSNAPNAVLPNQSGGTIVNARM